MLRTTRIKLIGYVRAGNSELSIQDQQTMIENYCLEHNYRLVQVFEDTDRPSYGLSQALSAMDTADGMIVTDLVRFVTHTDDRLLELRPLIDKNFLHKGKILISITDGIETATPQGQEAAIGILDEWYLKEEWPAPTASELDHPGYKSKFVAPI